MRIAYLSSACIPSRTANSIHVMKMCQALARAGHEVVLFAPDNADGRELWADDPFAYYGVASNFTIEHLPWVRMSGRGYWYGWQAARRVRKSGFDLTYGRNLAACSFASWWLWMMRTLSRVRCRRLSWVGQRCACRSAIRATLYTGKREKPVKCLLKRVSRCNSVHQSNSMVRSGSRVC